MQSYGEDRRLPLLIIIETGAGYDADTLAAYDHFIRRLVDDCRTDPQCLEALHIAAGIVGPAGLKALEPPKNLCSFSWEEVRADFGRLLETASDTAARTSVGVIRECVQESCSRHLRGRTAAAKGDRTPRVLLLSCGHLKIDTTVPLHRQRVDGWLPHWIAAYPTSEQRVSTPPILQFLSPCTIPLTFEGSWGSILVFY